MRTRWFASGLTVFLVLFVGLPGCGEDATSPPPCRQITYSTIESQSVTVEPAQTCYESGTNVVATATSGNGWAFVGWTGGVISSENPLSFRMGDGNLALVANYAEELFALDIGVMPANGGQVEGPPLTTAYRSGDQLTLTAYPAPGYDFASWSGDMTSTTNPLTITVASDLTLTARFEARCYELGVDVVGAGSVQVNPDEPCYGYGVSVSMLAVSEPGSDFVGWSGDASGTTNPLQLVIEDDTNVVATFATPVTVTFVNPVFTDIEITVAGAGTRTIPPSDSVDYYYAENPGTIDVTAQTGGQTIQATPIGLLLGWNFSLDLVGETSVSVDLIIPSEFFYLYVQNQGTANLGPLVVNPDTQYETVDDILLPNDGLIYRTGYYRAFTGMEVRGFFPDQMAYIYWTEGVHFQMPWQDNQSVQLYNALKRSATPIASDTDPPATPAGFLERLVIETPSQSTSRPASAVRVAARELFTGSIR